MNETIGVKGGKNDRRRTFKIRQAKVKKEQDELKELEKKVKSQQKFTLIKTLPIVITGGVIKTFFEPFTRRQKEEKKSDSSGSIDNSDDKEIVVPLQNGESVRVQVHVFRKKREKSINHQEEINESENENKIEGKSPYQVVEQESIPIREVSAVEIEKKKSLSEISEEELSAEARDTFQKLKARKIIESYEEELKEIRYELRSLVSDYQVLAEEKEEIIFSEEAMVLLDKLSFVISRIEVLKNKIQIHNLNQYDDNYIYTLIEDYLSEYDQGNLISEMKDSPLYIMIAEKISQLDVEKDCFSNDLSRKKKELEDREVRFQELWDHYYSIEKVNQQLLSFQNEQDALLRDVQDKIQRSETISERVKIQVDAMNSHSRRFMQLMAFQMFFPGPKGAKRLATVAATYLYFANQIMKPKKTTKKYRIIQVKDYSGEIKNSMSALDDAESLLEKTDMQIDQLMAEIMTTYHDYLDVLPECGQLLSRLDQVKDEIGEKKYEMQRIREEQIYLLDQNHEKVMKRGEYPV